MKIRISRFFLMFLIPALLAANSLAQIKQMDIYAEQINLGSIEEKREALYQLRNLETEEASRIALRALKDSAEIIRATATHSILALPAEEAAQNLLPLLKDKSQYVREEAAYALGKTKSKVATENLIFLLQKDKKDEVRGACALALGLIADERAVEPLIISLSKKNLFIQRSAARSLGQIGDIKAIPFLEKILSDPKRHDDVKREAKEALERLRKNLN